MSERLLLFPNEGLTDTFLILLASQRHGDTISGYHGTCEMLPNGILFRSASKVGIFVMHSQYPAGSRATFLLGAFTIDFDTPSAAVTRDFLGAYSLLSAV